jgi:hypothetical protein
MGLKRHTRAKHQQPGPFKAKEDAGQIEFDLKDKLPCLAEQSYSSGTACVNVQRSTFLRSGGLVVQYIRSGQ